MSNLPARYGEERGLPSPPPGDAQGRTSRPTEPDRGKEIVERRPTPTPATRPNPGPTSPPARITGTTPQPRRGDADRPSVARVRREVKVVRKAVPVPATPMPSSPPAEVTAPEPPQRRADPPPPQPPRVEYVEQYEYEYEDRQGWLVSVSEATGKGVPVLKAVLLLISGYIAYRVLWG